MSKETPFVLIVDDDPIHISVATSLMKKSGFEVMSAGDGLAAIELIGTNKFDLIMTDHKMPKMTGQELVKVLRKSEYTKNIPVIVVSSLVKTENKSKLANIQFLPKPFTEGTLQKVKETLASSMEPPKESKKEDSDDVFNEDIVLALSEASLQILHAFGIEDAKAEENSKVEKNEELFGDITAVMAFDCEEFQSKFYLTFDKSSFLFVISSMLMEEYDDINDENLDGIGEICNMIVGNAKKSLEKYKIAMSTPSIICGDRHRIVQESQLSQGLKQSFKFEKGQMNTIWFR